jgi:hypothetical protein
MPDDLENKRWTLALLALVWIACGVACSMEAFLR